MNKELALQKIQRLRERVIESQEINNMFYDKLVAELGFKPHSTDEEFLFAAIFNSLDQSEFEKALENIKL
jgi:hypothetical protein